MSDDERRSDVARRATAIYEERIRTFIEKEHFGKVVSIEVDSGDFEISVDRQDRWAAVDRLRGRHEVPTVFSLRVGGGTVARIGDFRKIGGTPA